MVIILDHPLGQINCSIVTTLVFFPCISDLLSLVQIDGPDAREVLNTIKDSYLNSRLNTAWKPKQVEMIRNKDLQNAYQCVVTF